MGSRWVSLFVIIALLFSTIGASGNSNITVPEASMEEPTIQEFDLSKIDFAKVGTVMDGGMTVNLNYISFDPMEERPIIPEDMTFSGDLYLVQFKDRIMDPDKAQVTALGAELLQYIPNNAFVVRMDPSTAKAVRDLSTVRVVTSYHVFYKIAPDIAGLMDGHALVNFMVWRHHSTEPTAAHARAVGAVIDWVDPLMVRAWVDRGQMLNIASNTDVWYAQMQPTWELHNNLDSDIIDARHYPDGAYNNPTDGVWTYSGGTGGTFQGLATGLGVIVGDVDTGVDGTHNNFGDATDYPNKKVWFKSYASANTWFDTNGHGTHTSGTAVGIGKHRNGAFDGLYSGMAPEAGLVGIRMDGGSVYNWQNDPYAHGANLTTNSWGGGTLGSYDQSAAAYDSLVIDVDLQKSGDQPMPTFFSAGNSGASGLSPPATGKNVISVGASGGTSGSQNSVAGFSSRGPVADGRMKPEIVAPGTSITSSWRGSTDFTDAQGTSMACPTAAGAAALIIDYYNSTYGFTPSPALIKALMTNGATILGYTYPGNTQGWGRLNVAKTMIETSTRKIFFKEEDDSLAISSGMFASYPITVSTNAEMRIQVAWSDEPGNPGSNPALVNDLDVRLKDPSGNTYMGNLINGGVSVQGTTADSKNNLEGFRFTSPATGQWTLEIIGTNVPEGPQVWALVISGDISVGAPTLHFLDIGVVDIALSDTNPVEGDDVTITATVKNVGNLPSADIEWRVKVDDSTIMDGKITLLGSDEETQIEATWNALRGGHLALVEIDYRERIIELNEKNNTLEKGFTVTYYGFEADLIPTLQEVQPGDNTTFRVEIENLGTLADTYDIVITDPSPGFDYDLEASEVSIGLVSKEIIRLEVSTPQQADFGTEDIATITVTSRGNASYTMVLKATTKIKRIVGFEMTPIDSTVAHVEPTGSVEFEINLTNLGNDQEIVTISLMDTNPSFTANSNSSTVVLGAYSTEVLKLTVTPPFQPTGGDYTMVTVNAETSSDLTAYLDYTVTVIDYHNLSILTILDENEVDPGEDVEFESVISNLGNNDESLEMWADLPEDWTVSFDEEIPYVLAYGFLEDYFTVSVPDDALAGTYEIVIGGTGEYIEYEERFEVIVAQQYGTGIDISPLKDQVKQNEKVTFLVKVTNKGNGEDEFDLFVDGGPSSLKSTFEENPVKVAAGGTAEVRLTFEALTTLPGTFSMSVESISVGNKAKSDKVAFQLQVLEVPKDDKKDKDKEKPPIVVIDDDDGTNSSLFSRYGLALLVGLIILIIIIALAVWAVIRRSKARDEMGPPPDAGDQTFIPMTMDELEGPMGPGPAPNPPGPPPSEGPPPPPPLDQGGPPSEGPGPVEGGMMPTTEPPPPMNGPVSGTEGAPQLQEPRPPQPVGPPAPQPMTGPPPQPEPPLAEPPPPPTRSGPDTSGPVGPEGAKRSAPKEDEIDSMITDLMGKLD